MPVNVEEAKVLLEPFLKNNPYSKVEENTADDPSPNVKLPWGDSTVEFSIPPEPENFVSAMNSIILPERFSAIWHTDTKDLEVLYTAFPLRDQQADMYDRKFSFDFDKRKYLCEFADSSERLMTIAERAVRAGVSNTDLRNIASFAAYVHGEKGTPGAKKITDGRPTSFWIRNIEWNEDDVVDLALHMNFYMSYFDIFSPFINIFSPSTQEKTDYKQRERYVTGYFPTEIRGRDMNVNSLHFWMQARKDDPLRRFLYAFQIIEHAAFYFVEEGIRQSLRKILTLPHIKDELDSIVAEMIDSLAGTKTWEGTKMEQLLREAVDPKLVWAEIEKNKGYFSKPHDFDGGYKITALITTSTNYDGFANGWDGRICKALRGLRNSLSHGRELSTSGVILPSTKNFNEILPWVWLAMLIAGEVMVYQRRAI